MWVPWFLKVAVYSGFVGSAGAFVVLLVVVVLGKQWILRGRACIVSG